MREFLEELARNPIAAPLLVIGTARPELDDGDSEFLADVTSVARIVLAPLSPDDARRLVSNVFEVPAVAPDLVEHILERSNGNPLFVEEFVRLLRDRDLVESHDGMLRLRPGAALPVPGGLTALLSARLDALPVEQKSTLADASVLGKVFWAGAIQAMGDRAPLDVDTALMALTRKEFIRLARDSTMNGEMEYIFWHVMARDVAYGALPRSARAARPYRCREVDRVEGRRTCRRRRGDPRPSLRHGPRPRHRHRRRGTGGRATRARAALSDPGGRARPRCRCTGRHSPAGARP